MSSSLKEKWTSDSGPAGGSAKAGGRGRTRGAALERMSAKRLRHAHGDDRARWHALLARPEVFAAATAGAASTPALPVTPPGTSPGVRASPRPLLRGGLRACLLPRGALRNSAHTSRLSPFPRASEGAPGSGFPGSEPASDPAFSPASLTSSWARWRSLNAACPRGGNDLLAGAGRGPVTKPGRGAMDAGEEKLGDWGRRRGEDRDTERNRETGTDCPHHTLSDPKLGCQGPRPPPPNRSPPHLFPKSRRRATSCPCGVLSLRPRTRVLNKLQA